MDASTTMGVLSLIGIIYLIASMRERPAAPVPAIVRSYPAGTVGNRRFVSSMQTGGMVAYDAHDYRWRPPGITGDKVVAPL